MGEPRTRVGNSTIRRRRKSSMERNKYSGSARGFLSRISKYIATVLPNTSVQVRGVGTKMLTRDVRFPRDCDEGHQHNLPPLPESHPDSDTGCYAALASSCRAF